MTEGSVILTIGAAICTALLTAMKILWDKNEKQVKVNEERHATTLVRLEDCETDRADLKVSVAVLTARVDLVENKQPEPPKD